ncbi:hypothetical protein INR49_009921, partial [Caranx melampygus]
FFLDSFTLTNSCVIFKSVCSPRYFYLNDTRRLFFCFVLCSSNVHKGGKTLGLSSTAEFHCRCLISSDILQVEGNYAWLWTEMLDRSFLMISLTVERERTDG